MTTKTKRKVGKSKVRAPKPASAPAPKEAKPEADVPRGGNVKFTRKYDVKLASNFDADPARLVIPPLGHWLYDPDGNTVFNPARVKSIDALGKYVGAIPVWANRDTGQLEVIDGRGNVLDVREVNRIRREDNPPRAPIPITVSRFPGTEEEAQDYVAQRNFLRKRPGLLHTAREILRFRRLGRAWERIAEILGLEGEGEAELKRRIPIAHCVTEVVEAIETKRLPAGKAKKFGGAPWDGSGALSREEQLKLLAQELAAKSSKRAGSGDLPPLDVEPRTKPIARAARRLLAEAFANGRTRGLDATETIVARAMAALIRRLDGEAGALSAWPKLDAIVTSVLAKPDAKPDVKPEDAKSAAAS